MNTIAEVRPSPIAGTWYSGDPAQLREQVDRYLDRVTLPDPQGPVTALVAPHAGHRYSGQTAAYAFTAVRGQEHDLVAVVSPMHAPYPADLITTGHAAYGTPLGAVPVDQEAVRQLDELLAADGLRLARVVNDREHSLEIELPFLQRALRGSFHLLPVMVRSQSPLLARRLGNALAQVLRGSRSGLLVASTDLSHFYPEEIAQQLDAEMLRRVSSFTPEAVLEAEETGKGYACGAAALTAVMWAASALGADKVEILHHSTSGDETGDYSSVVGYGAAVIRKRL